MVLLSKFSYSWCKIDGIIVPLMVNSEYISAYKVFSKEMLMFCLVGAYISVLMHQEVQDEEVSSKEQQCIQRVGGIHVL